MEQGSRVFHVVERSRDLLSGPGIDVGPHLADAVVCHLLRQVGVQLVLSDVLALLGDGPEGSFDLLGRLNVFGLLGDHVSHVVLEGNVSVAVGVDHVQDGFELGFRFALFEHGKVVAESSEAGLELVVVESARLVLVEVSEHHGELLEGVLGHSGLVASLDLLLQVVLDAHAELVQLIPLLGKADSRVLSVTENKSN